MEGDKHPSSLDREIYRPEQTKSEAPRVASGGYYRFHPHETRLNLPERKSPACVDKLHRQMSLLPQEVRARSKNSGNQAQTEMRGGSRAGAHRLTARGGTTESWCVVQRRRATER